MHKLVKVLFVGNMVIASAEHMQFVHQSPMNHVTLTKYESNGICTNGMENGLGMNLCFSYLARNLVLGYKFNVNLEGG